MHKIDSLAVRSDVRDGPSPSEEIKPATRTFTSFMDTVLAGLAGVLSILCVLWARPSAFTLSGDSWILHLPGYRLHTNALLGGELPLVFWQFGSGYSPFESGQSAVLYPPIYLCDLLCRAVGQPYFLMEALACFHLMLTGLFGFRLCPWNARHERFLFATLLCSLPGSVLLGMNWPIYLFQLPWFVALCLLMLGDRQPNHLWIFGLSNMLFASSHVQMYVYSLTALFLLMFAMRSTPKRWLLLALHQLPYGIAMLPLLWISRHANMVWRAGREASDYLLHYAFSLPEAVLRICIGNLVAEPIRILWGTAGSGVGILFGPMLFLVLGLSLYKKRFGTVAFFGAGLVVLGVASFPFLSHVAVGPFAGFRWTWKLVIVIHPLAVITFAKLRSERLSLTEIVAYGCLSTLGYLSIAVGSNWNLTPSTSAFDQSRAVDLIETTQKHLARHGIVAGDRIVFLFDRGSLSAPRAVPYFMLMAHGAVEFGLHTLNIYQPIEHEAIAEKNLFFSVPWRHSLVLESQADLDEMRRQGVTVIVSNSPIHESSIVTLDGQRLPFVSTRIAEPPSFWPAVAPQHDVQITPGGTLVTVWGVEEFIGHARHFVEIGTFRYRAWPFMLKNIHAGDTSSARSRPQRGQR